MSRRREILGLCLFGLGVAALVTLGLGARATYGARTTADEPQYLLSALSLWEDGDLDISDELSDQRYRDFHEVELPEQTVLREDGSRISPHDPLLPLLLAVPMGLGGWVGAKLALAVVAGLLAASTVWTARHRFGVAPGVAYVAVGLIALAPPLAVYSTQVYPELPAALALLAGLAAILGPFERRGRIVFVVAVVALPWLAVKYVPLAAVLAVVGLMRAARGQRLVIAGWLGAAAILYVVGHLVIYDGLTSYASGDHFVGGEFAAIGSQVDLWGRSTRLLGLLVDGGFGIGAWQPAFLLLPVVAGWSFVTRRDGFAAAGSLLVVGWLVATFVALTMHGWWFPGRQLVVVIPVAVLLVATWANEGRRRLAVLAVLGVAGVVAFGFLVFEGLGSQLTWVVDFGSTTNPLYQGLSRLMPDYMAPSTVTWVLHGLWAGGAVALIWMGGSMGGSDPEPSSLTHSDTTESKERVLT